MRLPAVLAEATHWVLIVQEQVRSSIKIGGHIFAHSSLKHTLHTSLVTQAEGLADCACAYVPLYSLQFISQHFNKC